MDIELTRISSKGQVVIPRAIRRKLRLSEGATFAVSAKDGLIVLKRVKDSLEREDLETLAEIKAAWSEIAAGKAKRMTAQAFLDNATRW